MNIQNFSYAPLDEIAVDEKKYSRSDNILFRQNLVSHNSPPQRVNKDNSKSPSKAEPEKFKIHISMDDVNPGGKKLLFSKIMFSKEYYCYGSIKYRGREREGKDE